MSLKKAWYSLIFLSGVSLLIISTASLIPILKSNYLDKALFEKKRVNGEISLNIERRVEQLVSILQNKSDAIAYSMLLKHSDHSLIQDLLYGAIRREDSLNALAVLAPEGHVLSSLDRDRYDKNSVQYEFIENYDYWPFSDDSKPDGFSPELAVPLYGRTYIGPVHETHGRGWNFHIAVPVGTAENVVAVLLAEVAVNTFWESVDHFLSDQRTLTYLVDRRGSLMTAPKNNKYQSGDLMTHMPITRSLFTGKEWQSKNEYQGLKGNEVFGVITPVKTVSWGGRIRDKL
ncbi:MAG: cache domain-containing protein [Gammaproteobacteria bacterium]